MAKGGQVAIRFTGDAAKAQQELDKLQAKVGQLEGKLRKVGQAGRGAGRETGSALDSAAMSAVSFATALTGVGSAVAGIQKIAQQLREEYENLVQRQEAAGLTQVSYAEARNVALLNAPTGMRDVLPTMVERVSQRSGMEQVDIYGGLGAPLSAMGPATPEQLESALTVSAILGARTGMGRQYGDYAATLLSMMPKLGVTDAASALGFTMQAGQASRVVELRKQAQMFAPVIGAAGQYGWSSEQAAEFTAALSHMMEDPTGETTRTSALRLMGMTAGGAEIIPMGGGRFAPTQARGFGAIAELQQWYAQAAPDEREQLLRKIGGEERAKGAIKAMLAGSPLWQQYYGTARGLIAPPGTGQARLVSGVLAEMLSDQPGTLQGILSAMRQTEEAQELTSPEGIAGALRPAIGKFAQTYGMTGLQQDYLKYVFERRTEFGTAEDVYGTTADIARGVQAQYLPLRGHVPWWKGGPLFPEYGYARQPTGAEGVSWEANPRANPDVVERLDLLIEKLERAADAQDRSADAMNTAFPGGPQPKGLD